VLVAGAGFQRVVVRTATKMVRFPGATDYVRVQLSATPLALLFRAHVAGDRDRVIRAVAHDVGAALSRYLGADGLVFPQEVHVVLAVAGR
jgi:hypothetical protein